MSNFKAGDPAITLIDLGPIMAGSVVELDCPIAKGDIIGHPSGRLIALENGWICLHPLVPGRVAYKESALMPLRGDPEPESQKALEVSA
ncbi:hypothetical protein DMX10_14810 [Pseudomonas sp. 57B-090624]|uniref:hypothetical protein n=1 Tax=Pseudomonas sp. 57B-090624 TaxID=2213080 RepID=UPI000DA77F8E|nr:hypothetical protein [Pseudomonas sp. 57B-090624]PZE12714.1 hypothetical protein DMX10_14810 [Pseudomonas sp. 57B-090624]